MSNIKRQKLFIIFFLGILLFPQVSLAGSYFTCQSGYVSSGGKCCSEDHPYYWPSYYEHADDKCCREISGPDNNECTAPVDPENTIEVIYEGLVPCGVGKTVYVNGTPRNDIPCQFCHFFVMIDGILDFVITMAFIIAVLMIVIAGAMFIFAYLGGMEVLTGGGKGGPKLLSQAKKTLSSVVTGLIIIFAAWVLVNTIFVFLGVADWTLSFTGPGKWSQMNCPIELPE